MPDRWGTYSNKCNICGEAVELLTKVHMRKHGITKEQYVEQYPEQKDGKYWGDLPHEAQKCVNLNKRGVV